MQAVVEIGNATKFCKTLYSISAHMNDIELRITFCANKNHFALSLSFIFKVQVEAYVSIQIVINFLVMSISYDFH